MRTTLRILYIVAPNYAVPPQFYGGVERIVDLMARHAKDDGHDVSVLANKFSTCPVRIIPWKTDEIFTRFGRSRALIQTTGIALREKFDIVHNFTGVSVAAPFLVSRSRVVITFQLPVQWRAVRAARQLNRHVHFTAVGDHMIRSGQPKETWSVVPNCVSLSEYSPNNSVPNDAPLVMLGRLAPQKGFHTGIAVARATGRRLIIAGNIDRDEGAYFENMIAPHIDGDRVRYVGPVDNAGKNTLLREAAGLLMPVEWDEPFGIVMAEAMACGTPVVGFARGAIPEVVEHNMTGYVCADMQAMIDAVMKLGSIDRRNCRRRVEILMSSETVWRQYSNIYNALSRTENA